MVTYPQCWYSPKLMLIIAHWGKIILSFLPTPNVVVLPLCPLIYHTHTTTQNNLTLSYQQPSPPHFSPPPSIPTTLRQRRTCGPHPKNIYIAFCVIVIYGTNLLPVHQVCGVPYPALHGDFPLHYDITYSWFEIQFSNLSKCSITIRNFKNLKLIVKNFFFLLIRSPWVQILIPPPALPLHPQPQPLPPLPTPTAGDLLIQELIHRNIYTHRDISITVIKEIYLLVWTAVMRLAHTFNWPKLPL